MKQKNQWKLWHKIVLAIIFLIFIGIFTLVSSADKEAEAQRLTDPKEQRADLIKKAFSEWDGSQKNLVEYVKKKMNDPKSFEHVKTNFWDNGKTDTITIKMTYRGKNAFNATVTNLIMARAHVNGDLIEIIDQ